MQSGYLKLADCGVASILNDLVYIRTRFAHELLNGCRMNSPVPNETFQSVFRNFPSYRIK